MILRVVNIRDIASKYGTGVRFDLEVFFDIDNEQDVEQSVNNMVVRGFLLIQESDGSYNVKPPAVGGSHGYRRYQVADISDHLRRHLVNYFQRHNMLQSVVNYIYVEKQKRKKLARAKKPR